MRYLYEFTYELRRTVENDTFNIAKHNVSCQIQTRDNVFYFKFILQQVLCFEAGRTLYFIETDLNGSVKTFIMVCIHSDRWRNWCCELKFGNCQSLVLLQ